MSTPEAVTLECPCCGDDGAVSVDGYFSDGQPLTCGCPGWVVVEEDGDAWVNNGDTPCQQCEGETR